MSLSVCCSLVDEEAMRMDLMDANITPCASLQLPICKLYDCSLKKAWGSHFSKLATIYWFLLHDAQHHHPQVKVGDLIVKEENGKKEVHLTFEVDEYTSRLSSIISGMAGIEPRPPSFSMKLGHFRNDTRMDADLEWLKKQLTGIFFDPPKLVYINDNDECVEAR